MQATDLHSELLPWTAKYEPCAPNDVQLQPQPQLLSPVQSRSQSPHFPSRLQGHLEACRNHDDYGLQLCFGTMRRAKNARCGKKATSRQVNILPTCRLHQNQLKDASYCKVRLACGFECGRVCEFKPHMFQRCTVHLEHPKPCYFFKIPLELRMRIYDILLPNKDIPARYKTVLELRTDGRWIHPAILRVNRQIHDEAARLMYAVNTFGIQLSECGLSMCINEMKNPPLRRQPEGHQLQDYQMQLMLLEQQNKKRLMLARLEQERMMPRPSYQSQNRPQVLPNLQVGQAGPSNVRPFHALPLQGPAPHFPQFPTSIESIWQPQLSSKYFNLIQNFRIDIQLINPIVPGVPAQDREAQQIHRLYEFSDHLHTLASRLQLTGHYINRLEISLNFSDTYDTQDAVLSAVDLLLRPFRRLCNISRAEVISIKMRNGPNPNPDSVIDLLSSVVCRNDNLTEYLQTFSHDLSQPAPSLPSSQVFDGYWKLNMLLEKIKNHCDHAATQANPDLNSGFRLFRELKHRARVAREDDDLTGFKEIFEMVVETWQRYLDWEKEFQVDTWGIVEGIWDVVAEGG